jgi:membrane protein required for colicin V production
MDLSAHNGVDLMLGAVLLLSALVGIARGLVLELMALAGWVVAFVAAQVFSPQLAPHLPIGSPGSGLNQAVALALTFIAAVVVWTLLARLLRLLVHATPLKLPDRLLGGLFGVLRGVLVLLVAATVVALTPAHKGAAWQASYGAQWLGGLLRGMQPWLPAELARHINV